jgi:RNA polymerase subunit RPABC4/transcription elongation factor Spt4
MIEAPNNVCPRCGGSVPNDAFRGQYPGALSRWDNTTEICSECGLQEALLQWRGGPSALNPVTGPAPWLNPPRHMASH